MPTTKSWAAIAALPALLLASQAFAAVNIDFESEALNTSISTQYQPLGVVFSSPGNPTQPEINTFSGNSTTGHLLADYSVVGGIQLDATFTTPITAISALAYANPSYLVTMRAYDAGNNLIGTATSAGGAFNQGTLSLSGIGQISKVTWSSGSDIAAVGIDNLSFTPAVPEPQSWAMLAAGLLVVSRALRRKGYGVA